ncbi:MAG: DUF488 domain-containing protein [Thermoflavifilum sp.]|nr:DUF488 domain-containing protein [Thermoflavifilum sp.]
MPDLLQILTIGHSVHPLDEFISLLKLHGVQLLADIRSFPGSRHVPQFNAEALAASLQAENIAYKLVKNLGGRRKAHVDSINTGWHHPAFRGFADYMQTADFARGLIELLEMASQQRTCIMCAEAMPWRCHRSLVADALLIKDVQVWHIFPDGSLHPHRLTPFAQVRNGILIYPSPDNLPLAP